MKTLLLLLTFSTSSIFAQEICESPNKTLADLNTIEKCSVKEIHKVDIKKDTRKITVRLTPNRKRYLKRRELLQNSSIPKKTEKK